MIKRDGEWQNIDRKPKTLTSTTTISQIVPISAKKLCEALGARANKSIPFIGKAITGLAFDIHHNDFTFPYMKMSSKVKTFILKISFISVADYALQLYWIGSFMQQVHRIIAVSTMIQLSQDQSYVWTHKIAIAWMFMRPCIGMNVTMLTNNLEYLERSGYTLYIRNTDPA